MTRPRISLVLVVTVTALGCASSRGAARAAPTQAPAAGLPAAKDGKPAADAAAAKGAPAPAGAVASNAGKTAPPKDDGSALVCEDERPTGSHILKRVCRRVDDMGRQRAAAQELLVKPRASESRR